MEKGFFAAAVNKIRGLEPIELTSNQDQKTTLHIGEIDGVIFNFICSTVFRASILLWQIFGQPFLYESHLKHAINLVVDYSQVWTVGRHHQRNFLVNKLFVACCEKKIFENWLFFAAVSLFHLLKLKSQRSNSR